MGSRPLLAIDGAIKTFSILLLAWAVLNPELPQFTGKAFTGRALAYPVALAVAPHDGLGVGCVLPGAMVGEGLGKAIHLSSIGAPAPDA